MIGLTRSIQVITGGEWLSSQHILCLGVDHDGSWKNWTWFEGKKTKQNKLKEKEKQKMKFGRLGEYTGWLHAYVRNHVWKEENPQGTTWVEDTPVCSSRVSGEEIQWGTWVEHTPMCLSRVLEKRNLCEFWELRGEHGLGTRPCAWPCSKIEGKRWKITHFKLIFSHF